MDNYGLLGLPRASAAFVAGEQIPQRRLLNNIQAYGGLLGLQGQMQTQAMQQQTAPLQLEMLKAQVAAAQNPQLQRIDLGGSWGLLDRAGNIVSQIPKSATPDTQLKEKGAQARHETPSGSAQLRSNVDLYKWGNISPYQSQQIGLEAGRLANQGIETQFNTGRGVTAPQQLGMIPQGGWQIPPAVQAARDAEANRIKSAEANGGAGLIPTPNVVAGSQAGLSPKALQDIEVAKRKNTAELTSKREYNMTGLNDTINQAERILTNGRPTESGVGTAVDYLGSLVGVAPKGSAAADQLRSISGALTAKMPRMEGPQSDKDVQLYREMAGQVGDSSLPTSRRLAALQTVRSLWAKYENQPQAAPASTGGFKILGVER